MNLFVSNIDKTVSFEMLQYDVWHDIPVDHATIRAEVHRLKKILKENLIESVKGIGYRLKRVV